MKQMMCFFLLSSILLFHKVVSNNSFLQKENLESYTADLLKVYDTVNIDHRTNATMVVKNLFTKMNNFINSLATNNVHLRFDTESISFRSIWNIPKQTHDDLNDSLITAKYINEFFASYYIDFLDGYYTINLIQHFIRLTIYSAIDGLYNNIAKLSNIILSRPALVVNDQNFFDKISNKLNEKLDQLCERQSTRQQFLISLYSFIIKTQFRAFIMLTSAYKLYYLLSNDPSIDYLIYISRLRTRYLSTWKYYLMKMQLALAKTSTEYYDCQATHNYNYNIQNVYAIELSSTIVNYKQNKVVTGIQLELRDGFLSLILYDRTLLPNGKLSTQYGDFHSHYASHRRPLGYSFPKTRKFDYKFTEIEYVHDNFWKNITFLQTKVPQNHVIIGANFEVLQLYPNSTTNKKVLYIRLHCAKVNITTGQIDASNIIYTKVWKKDDPWLQQHPEFVEDHSFSKNVESIYNKILVNVGNSSTNERWRRKPPLTSYVDSKIIQVYPPLPVTSIGLWKNKYGKDSNHLSLKILTMDISSDIKYG